jgi:hypothetical protein
MATVAVFLALGGGAYAGVSISRSKAVSPAVRVTNSGGQAIPSFTGESVTFNTNAYDNDHMHSTTTHTTRLVAPISGVYDITGGVAWNASATGERDLWIERNRSTHKVLAETTVAVNSGSQPSYQMVETQARLTKGDFVELWVYQGSGGDIGLIHRPGFEPVFAMHFLGP